MSSHFQILSLCTAGRDTGSFAFEIASLKEQVDYFIRLVKHFGELGFQVGKIKVYLTAFNPVCYDLMNESVLDELSQVYPDVNFEFRQEREEGKGYYQDVAFHIYATDASGTREYQLVDGGNTDWTQQLLNNKEERFFASRMGSERFVLLFDPKSLVR